MVRHGTADNRLLLLLDADTRAQLGPLRPVELDAREVLYEPGMPALHAYFPLTAVVSLVSTMESGASAEVALVGREGLIGLGDVLGLMESPTSAVVQVPGTALRVPTAALRAARRASREIANVVDLYTEARLIQVAQTAACNRLHTVDARLARWLLAIHNRIDGDEVVIAQEFIADMLGVHRPTVSIALQRLQEQHAIVRRGRAIIIADRCELEKLACECHRVLERAFERVFSRGAADAELPPARSAPRVADAELSTTASLEALRDIAGRLLLANIREQEAREAAEAANRAKDQFLAMVSHELRTPLNAILGWCAILNARQEEAFERGLPIIERNARAQLKVVEDLLDAARITSGTLSIHAEQVNLPELVHSAVDAIRPVAEEKSVALRLAAAEHELSPVFGDPDRLRQVLLNVLMNSLKFTDAGGSVDVQLGSDGGRAQVIIEDTGRGISPAVLPHVFDRFRQGSSAAGSDHRRGLGLGLTISRALVELHGGRIDITSPGENQGTTCTIELPLSNERRVSTTRPTSVDA
jgi:signal transduction histidine kinase